LGLLKLLDDRAKAIVLNPLGLDERFQRVDIVGQRLAAVDLGNHHHGRRGTQTNL
jgi:hypothetical protein